MKHNALRPLLKTLIHNYAKNQEELNTSQLIS